MQKRKLNILVVLLVLLACTFDLFAGGDQRNATGGAQELLIPVGARGLAMSSAYLAGIQGIEAIYYNPAGLSASNNDAEAMFSYMSYLADIGVSYAAAAVHLDGFGSIGFSIKTLDFGDITRTTETSPYGDGTTFSPTFVVLGFTYSNSLTDRVRVGVNVKLVNEEIERTSATGVAFDAGIQYNGLAGVEGLKFGIAVKNLGPQMEFSGPDLLRRVNEVDNDNIARFASITAAPFEMPSQLELGVAYVETFADDYRGLIATTFQNNNFSHDEYNVAGEFAFQDMVFLRAGYSYVTQAADDEDEYLFGPTFGAGFAAPGDFDLTVEYAYRYARLFDANHMVSIKFGM